MKKFCAFFIVIVLTLLSSCSKENKLFDIDYKVYTYDSIRFATEKEVYSKDDTVIKYYIENISNDEACINSDSNCFSLHILVDSQWKEVGKKVDSEWTELGLILEPGQTEEREINLEEYYYLPLPEGTYRICMEGELSENFEIKH